MRVLIVDDENHVRDAIQLLLPWEELGFDTILTAESVREAIQILQEEKPELAIVDVVIGPVLGMDIMNYINDQRLNTRVIVISGHDDFQYVRAMFILGALEYLLKPIEQDKLREAVGKAVSQIQTASETEEEFAVDKQFKWLSPDYQHGLLRKYYLRAVKDETYWTSFWFTIKFSVFVVVISNLIGFFWAYVLSGDIPYKNFWRALIYAPRIIGGVVLGFLWRFIFQNVFVQFGTWTGIRWFSQQWFTTPESSFWALVIVMTWSLSGYLMIIYNSGLAAISRDYYEAATVDGASRWTTLKSITLPLLKGTTTRCLFIAINWAMLLYDTNISLTNGNPYRTSEGVMMNIYATAFRSNQISYGAAKSVLFIVVLLIVSFSQMKLTSRNEVSM